MAIEEGKWGRGESGFINLPSKRTLSDHTHWTSAQSGVQLEHFKSTCTYPGRWWSLSYGTDWIGSVPLFCRTDRIPTLFSGTLTLRGL